MLWNKSLETGIPAIDTQHKELFRQVDILFDKNNKDRVPRTLKFLGEYVVKHFNDEQLLQAKSRYPKALSHKKMHSDFVVAFTKMKQEYDNGNGSLIILLKINRAVSDWLKNHIMIHDKEFATYYKNLQKQKTEDVPIGGSRTAQRSSAP